MASEEVKVVVSRLDADKSSSVLAWPEEAKKLVIETPEQYSAAAEKLKVIKALIAEVDSTFDPNIKRWHTGHKEAIAEKKKFADPLAEAEKKIKSKMQEYDDERERLEAEERKRLEAAAIKEAEDRRLDEAEAMVDEGQAYGDPALIAEAMSLLEDPVETPVVYVPRSVPVVSGISKPETHRAEVVDLNQLVTFALANPTYRHLVKIEANQAALNGLARALRNEMKIPGVKYVLEKGIRVRA